MYRTKLRSVLTMMQTKDGFSVSSYAGDGAVLLAFNIQKNKIANFAGFSIQCTAPNKGPYKSNKYWLTNRLNFDKGLTKNVKDDTSKYVTSDQAPFQMFRWVHFPSAGPGNYTYSVYASYFKNDTPDLGPKIDVSVDLTQKSFPNVSLGFTRGYVSSQAYADRFKNKPIKPSKKSINFDTTPYLPQYKWLGADARQLVFDFLQECENDSSISLDVFAYDFDEPDIIRSLCNIGSRVRVFQDDAKLHTGNTALEPKTIAALENAGVKVMTGHFSRFAHDKVMIQKKNGKAIKVLTGSANFSIRGLYVQANSILVFDNAEMADLYEQAFAQAFADEKKFSSSPIASKWFDVLVTENLAYSVCFSPHKTSTLSLNKVSQAMHNATSSVLFAIMATSGGGDVMADLKNLSNRNDILSLGTIQQKSGLQLFKNNDDNQAVASFNFLDKNVPRPFKKEWSGGSGQVIHHKFVVCDFNGKSPVVFCGSSNLSSGGETHNGDNLVAIYDEEVVTCYAVEAIRLFDHYRFRSAHEKSTAQKPLKLKESNEDWITPFYDSNNIKSLERQVLCQA